MDLKNNYYGSDSCDLSAGNSFDDLVPLEPGVYYPKNSKYNVKQYFFYTTIKLPNL